jgi:hypothetical protein
VDRILPLALVLRLLVALVVLGKRDLLLGLKLLVCDQGRLILVGPLVDYLKPLPTQRIGH